MMDEIVRGTDELGVLLMGNPKGVYWYGSRLTIDEARRLIPHNNATSLQVTVSVLAGIIWAIENPRAGLVEAEYMDFARVLEIADPYLGEVVGVWGDWNPLKTEASCSPRISTPAIPGSSRISASCSPATACGAPHRSRAVAGSVVKKKSRSNKIKRTAERVMSDGVSAVTNYLV